MSLFTASSLSMCDLLFLTDTQINLLMLQAHVRGKVCTCSQDYHEVLMSALTCTYAIDCPEDVALLQGLADAEASCADPPHEAANSCHTHTIVVMACTTPAVVTVAKSDRMAGGHEHADALHISCAAMSFDRSNISFDGLITFKSGCFDIISEDNWF